MYIKVIAFYEVPDTHFTSDLEFGVVSAVEDALECFGEPANIEVYPVTLEDE